MRFTSSTVAALCVLFSLSSAVLGQSDLQERDGGKDSDDYGKQGKRRRWQLWQTQITLLPVHNRENCLPLTRSAFAACARTIIAAGTMTIRMEAIQAMTSNATRIRVDPRMGMEITGTSAIAPRRGGGGYGNNGKGDYGNDKKCDCDGNKGGKGKGDKGGNKGGGYGGGKGGNQDGGYGGGKGGNQDGGYGGGKGGNQDGGYGGDKGGNQDGGYR
ncbi:hypothetical protein MVEN_01663900 [Mycena venus]|uniref:Uncharacterized protein n=1 Tax=Mycena venus TaxID=2733690 RepID=A0A8H7CQZ7_9AGAR|nr:hypothetical protein MVEN_01663900 [Mycena venus]